MKYTVPVNFVIEAGSAAQAEERMKDLLGSKGLTGFSIHSPNGETDPKPALSPELAHFINSEIQGNDHDVEGYTTDLDYIKGTLEQMPDEDVVENSGYQGELDDEDFAKQLNAEFDAIYAKYGGGTTASLLLPDE